MNFTQRTRTRDDMIRFGHMLGRIFLMTERDAPWMATFSKTGNSGKSLVGSAIDEVFDPTYYPQGITTEYYADLLMYEKPKGSVKYLNLCNEKFETRQDFDLRLKLFEQAHPDARVLICANPQRLNLHEEFNYQANGLQSDRLDMNIDFHVEGPGFERRLVITAEDGRLCEALQKSGLRFEKF